MNNGDILMIITSSPVSRNCKYTENTSVFTSHGTWDMDTYTITTPGVSPLLPYTHPIFRRFILLYVT